ncbi:MAG: hypothetical protein M1821_005163 [Bathelium mastoideum]|nr:MAG: hypothetical protein M1821_005163 [Bathelium mastoideum]KAI9677815.1 MAG: hypothetical protein M1822_008127 [Bathelium mastoideum]
MHDISALPAATDDGGQSIVRSFSRKATDEFPGDDLATSLAIKEAGDENEEQRKKSLAYLWQDLFKTQQAAMVHAGTLEDRALDKASRELAQAWLKFQNCLPDGHKSKVDDSPPCLQDVLSAVTEAADQIKTDREQSKLGRWKGRFNKLCSTLNNHKDMFDCVPDGDKYVSLLAGSLSSIIKASARYEKIGDTITRGLEDLSDRIPFWHRQMEIHRRNPFMKRYLALLYVAIFRFLADIMKEWFQTGWGRLKRAFDNDYVDRRLNSATNEIRNLSEKLEKEAKLATEAKIQMVPTVGDFEAWSRQFQDEFYSRLGETVQRQLRYEYENHLIPVMNMVATRSSSPMLAISGHDGLDSLAPDTLEYDWSKLSAPLEKYNVQESLEDLIRQSQDLHVNFEMLQRIQYWFLEPISKILWISGPFQAPVPSRVTLTSAYVFDIARKAGVPVIVYFFDYASGHDPEGALLNMVYSLIFQMSRCMQNQPNIDLEALCIHFAKLDGSADSLLTALLLLEKLIKSGPELLLCIVDGLQNISYQLRDRPELQQLLSMLQVRPNSIEPKRKPYVKTLFTTDGFTDALASLSAEERLDVLDFTHGSEAEFGPGQGPVAFLSL